MTDYIEAPLIGCFKNIYKNTYDESRESILKKLCSIGSENGCYYIDWAWSLRGWIDRFIGGASLRRGRTHSDRLNNGDVLGC